MRELNRAFLARQLLLDRAHLSPLAAIEQLVALQAQVARPPFIGLWTRLHAFTRALSKPARAALEAEGDPLPAFVDPDATTRTVRIPR